MGNSLKKYSPTSLLLLQAIQTIKPIMAEAIRGTEAVEEFRKIVAGKAL